MGLGYLLRSAPNFKGGAHEVWGKRAVVPRANVELRIGWLGPELQIRVLHGVSNRVDSC